MTDKEYEMYKILTFRGYKLDDNRPEDTIHHFHRNLAKKTTAQLAEEQAKAIKAIEKIDDFALDKEYQTCEPVLTSNIDLLSAEEQKMTPFDLYNSILQYNENSKKFAEENHDYKKEHHDSAVLDFMYGHAKKCSLPGIELDHIRVRCPATYFTEKTKNGSYLYKVHNWRWIIVYAFKYLDSSKICAQAHQTYGYIDTLENWIISRVNLCVLIKIATKMCADEQTDIIAYQAREALDHARVVREKELDREWNIDRDINREIFQKYNRKVLQEHNRKVLQEHNRKVLQEHNRKVLQEHNRNLLQEHNRNLLQEHNRNLFPLQPILAEGTSNFVDQIHDS
jgi:hypothetical protein